MSCEVDNSAQNLSATDTGRIFNIQRYSLHDGTGIRTVVFFKGCPLTCPWCSNPESRSHRTTFIRRQAKCIDCEECSMDVEECPSGAWEQVGQDLTLDEVVEQIAKDDLFFETSNGGVTLSGGEVLTQPQFAIELLTRLKALGYRTAIETSGHGNGAQLLAIGKLCDEVLFDFKIMDADKAKSIININLKRVLANFEMLVKQGVRVIPRLPLIPGYTLDIANVERVLQFLNQQDPQRDLLKEIHLLPFHQYGANKYQTLGIEYQLADVPVPRTFEIDAVRRQVEAEGYNVIIGG